MPSELVLYLFLLDICIGRQISQHTIKAVSQRLWKSVQKHGAMTVAVGLYTLSIRIEYPRYKQPGFLYVPIYLVY